jgi:hypothetical protein
MLTAVTVALVAAERITTAKAAAIRSANVLEGQVTYYVADTFSSEQSSRRWGELVDAGSAERVTFEHSPQMVRCCRSCGLPWRSSCCARLAPSHSAPCPAHLSMLRILLRRLSVQPLGNGVLDRVCAVPTR